MQPRPRQTAFVTRFNEALTKHGNTLGLAPTGAGKTVMMALAGQKMPKPALLLQHTIELVAQNSKTFFKVDRRQELAFFTADKKTIARQGWTFGMMQTVVNHIDDMPAFGSVMIDEAHHASSDSYLKIIASLRKKNPSILIGGVTATPKRGDKKTLKTVFNNVCDEITLIELIESGFLVKPRGYVIDIGVRDDLKGVRKQATDFDMDEVAKIMDRSVVTDQVIKHWKEQAGDRQTVVFCANLAHARHTCEAFQAAGVDARLVSSKMPEGERRDTLADFDKMNFQVIVNVAVLTEGWDCQPVSCVVLLRPSSFQSTMIQMVGRGLRPVDPERYPGVTKHDCKILDFGTSLHTHPIEVRGRTLEGKIKDCPACHAELPSQCPECPLCGYEFPREPLSPPLDGSDSEQDEKELLADFVLTELELFDQSPFRWEELWGGVVFMACSFDSWAAALCFNGEWFTVAGAKETGIKTLAARTEKLIALAAGDDWMREHGSPEDAGKSKRWLTLPPSDGQLRALNMTAMQAMGMTRYRAACLMTWKWADKAIQAKVKAAVEGVKAHALAA
jgi:superfamily II DNA or RNA helicase